MALQVYQPEEMQRIGGGRGGSDGADEFAGLGGSFAANEGSGEFMARYLQERIKGMKRATVSPKVNEMRAMSSPEFALAQALGIKTSYSGMAGTDVTSARKTLDSDNSLTTRSQKEEAQKNIDKFRRYNRNTPLNPALRAAGLPGKDEPEFAGPTGSQSAFDEIQRRFGSGETKRNTEIPQSRTPGQGGAPTPTIPSSGDQAATPPSTRDAQNATRAPIGAPAIGAAGESEPNSTPVAQTTKGPRLDTSRRPMGDADDRSLAGTYLGGQVARRLEDSQTRAALSDSAKQNRVNALRAQDGRPEIDFDSEKPKLDKNAIYTAPDQERREAIKMKYDKQAGDYAWKQKQNKRLFGNEYGPDKGETRALQERLKTPRLVPLGGYDEDGVPVGPMTNKPAASQEEYDARIKKFDEDGERNKAAARQKKLEADAIKAAQERFPVKDKGKPTERGFAGPQPRYLGNGVIRRV